MWSNLESYALVVPPQALQGLRNNPHVDFIAPNLPIRTFGHTVQTDASWGLDRVDQQVNALDGAYHYLHDGEGVIVYVIDTAILPTHQEFESVLQQRANVHWEECPSGNPSDSHGTRVASIAAGATLGVARGATVLGYTALGCPQKDGTVSMTNAFDAVLGNLANHPGQRAVVNLSAGAVYADQCTAPGPGDPGEPCTGDCDEDPQFNSFYLSCPLRRDTALDAAVLRVIAAGVPVVAAAGNRNGDACLGSPGHLPETITVGATAISGDRWTDSSLHGSNHGSCVDIFAPGAYVRSATVQSTTSADSAVAGTSFAAPFVTGAVALFLQQNPNATPADVKSALISNSAWAGMSNPGAGSPNRALLVPRKLIAGIGGPTSVSAGQYQWQGSGHHGVGHYQYQWFRRDIWPNYTGPWLALDSTSTQSLTFFGDEQNFELRVEVRSGGQLAVFQYPVAGPCADSLCPEFTGGQPR
ncbi:MAG TPA: S8 family serine peptidase [Longimicrobiales bacterium]|nr:S8 family serine peptidase [Longimicrobiales bacterium]